ncbi:MAG: hypothetical protein AAF827_21360 [Cyanobacteria bacterium P01_D01_bin.6]
MSEYLYPTGECLESLPHERVPFSQRNLWDGYHPTPISPPPDSNSSLPVAYRVVGIGNQKFVAQLAADSTPVKGNGDVDAEN